MWAVQDWVFAAMIDVVFLIVLGQDRSYYVHKLALIFGKPALLSELLPFLSNHSWPLQKFPVVNFEASDYNHCDEYKFLKCQMSLKSFTIRYKVHYIVCTLHTVLHIEFPI